MPRKGRKTEHAGMLDFFSRVKRATGIPLILEKNYR